MLVPLLVSLSVSLGPFTCAGPDPLALQELSLGADPVEHVDALRGFRIDVPDGWQKVAREDPDHGHILTLVSPGSGGAAAVTVSVLAMPEGYTAEDATAKKLEALVARSEDIAAIESFDGTLGERVAKGLRFDLTRAGVTYRLEQLLCIEQGFLFTMQRHAPSDDFERAAEQLVPVRDSFAFVPRSVEAAADAEADARLAELVARCGSEVDWAQDWPDAVRRSRAEARPILVVAYFLESFALPSTPRTSTFMDEDIIALVGQRFVPLWYTERGSAPLLRQDGSAYAMGPFAFGQALLVVEPSGRVIVENQSASETDVAYPFLLSALAAAPELAGTPVDAELAGLERAELLADRGELDAAWAELERQRRATATPVSDAAALLRARVLGLRRDGAGALAELDAVADRSSGADHDPLRAELALERIELWLRSGDLSDRDAVLATAAELAASDFPADLRARAAVTAGAIELTRGAFAAAEVHWRAVVDEHPETRWASLAAVALQSDVASIGVALEYVWPPEDALAEALHGLDPAPLPSERASEAAAGALAWLLEHQRADGSLPGPSEVGYPASIGANPFVDATAALSGRAFLAAASAGLGDRAELEAAARRSLSYVLASVAGREAVPPLVLFMDYMTWSDGALLEFLAEALDAGLATEAELVPTMELLLEDLAARQQANGGWSYYKKNDLSADDVPPQSISFTTAAANLALSKVRASGVAVPDALLARSTRTLEELRDERGVFAYFLYTSGIAPHPTIASPAGDVGRGPACELALFRAGVSDPERLAGALELFFEHAASFAAEQGKVLMHAGPQGQGCHYLLFDYGHAAFAHAALPVDGGAERRRARILDLVLDCRQADGSFLDTPILGHAYGTSMALLALVSLK